MTATLEDVQQITVDTWGSLNTAASSAKLPNGQSPNNQNVWMDEKPGSLVTANGYTKLGTLPSNLPPTLIVDFFITSTGSQSVIISDGQNVYKTTDYVVFTTIKTGLSSFFQLRGLVIRDKLWLTNGSDDVMTYDGTNLVELDGSGGTPDVPLGKYIAYHDERVWLFGISGDPSSLRFSELTDNAGTEIAPDNASAWPSDNEIQVSEGDADIGTSLFLYRGYLYASKAYSIWRITGYDVYTYTRVKTRSSTGTRFAESIRELDNLIHLIGVDGLYVFDGEESKRISDIIDPASSDPGIFAFRNLQQPLLNNQFWNVSDTADFAAGTVPNVLDTSNNQLTLIPADDSQADFNTGTLSDTTASDNPGYLQLSKATSGAAGTLYSSGKPGQCNHSDSASFLGLETYITDTNLVNQVGWLLISGSVDWIIDLGSVVPIGQIIIRRFLADYSISSGASIQVNTGAYQAKGATNGTWVTVGSISYTAPTAQDLTFNFTTQNAIQVRILITDVAIFGHPNSHITITELEAYLAGYKSTGSFISSSIDYGSAPASFGALAASIVTNGETYQFSTQSSNDGSSWDAAVNVANGAAIGSTLRRFLRWRVTLNSSTGVSTPVIDKVYVGGTYISEVHNTGGNIFAWSAFQMSQNKAGQTINAYYRAASTSLLVASEAWTAIAPGAVPGADITDTFIQIRLELSTTDATQAPFVESFTVNWILANGSGVNTLQNVASIVILNRYWLAAATLGAESNDIVIIRGKATFGSPFMKKDFALLSFARIQDYFVAGSSTDGSIYRLEYGFSKNGEDMDSYFETGDYSKDGFIMKLYEILAVCDRVGPYNLTIGVSTDGGISWTDRNVDLTLASVTTNVGIVKKLNISFMSDKFRLRARINGADQPFSVDELKVYYRLTPSRGSLN